jgi:hypothetical protein
LALSRFSLACFAGLLLFAAQPVLAANYYLIVSGLGGEADYDTQFEKWASDLDRELRSNGPDSHVQKLSGAAATQAHIKEAFQQLVSGAQSDDAFALFLIGHGTFDGSEYKFNIPGPDLTGAELTGLLKSVAATRQLVVNMTSCSGASLAALAHKNRIVITATKSGTEKNATVFARYWIDALQDPAADTDKNGTVSALEAFHYAQGKVASYFETEKLLATEHPLFSDTGATTGIRDPKPENRQGLLAAAFPLYRPEGTEKTDTNLDPQKRKLLSRKQELEAKIDRLKYDKSSLPESEYKQQLTAYLLQLAQVQAELDK